MSSTPHTHAHCTAVTLASLPADHAQLCTLAVAALANSYAPYSQFPVGACLLARDAAGQPVFVSGVNVENSSYPLGVCAERSAVSVMVSRGLRTIEAVAVVAAKLSYAASPCGGCRQVLSEFAARDVPVYCCGNDLQVIERWTIASLLPGAFTPQDLNLPLPPSQSQQQEQQHS
jgi:cytidine deaminase